MKEIQVFDKFEGENFLINLGELIKRLEQIDTSLTDGEWQIANGAYGYGELICSIEDTVKNGSKYLVKGKRIFPVLKSGKEYFYHVCMKKVGSDFEIGLFDSTYIFVRSNDDELVKRIGNLFNEVKIIDL